MRLNNRSPKVQKNLENMQREEGPRATASSPDTFQGEMVGSEISDQVQRHENRPFAPGVPWRPGLGEQAVRWARETTAQSRYSRLASQILRTIEAHSAGPGQ